MGARPKGRMSHYGRFRDGITMAGVPVQSSHGGKVFWVDSGGGGTGAGTGFRGGGTWASPYLTLDRALDDVVADRGDIIFIKPGHTENVAAAGGITLDKAGCYIIGLGIYDQRPVFSWTATTSSMLVTAADVWIENIVFRANLADVVLCSTITAKGCHFINCRFDENGADLNWKDVLVFGATTDNACDGMTVVGCTFDLSLEDAASDCCINILKNTNDITIVGNKILGDFDATPYAQIYMVYTETSNNILIADNLIYNVHNANSDVGIMVSGTAQYGWVVRNVVCHQDTAGETPITIAAGGMAAFENYCSGVMGTASGYLILGRDT